MFCVVSRRREALELIEKDLKTWYPSVVVVLCEYDRDFERVMCSSDSLPMLIITDDSASSFADGHSMGYGHEISHFAGDHDIDIVRFSSHGYWPSLLRGKIAFTLDLKRRLQQFGKKFQHNQ